MQLYCLVAGQLFQEKEINMAGSPDRPRCSKCHHDCHCDNLVCSHPMGVGMTDKNAPCGCGVCECTPNRPDWG